MLCLKRKNEGGKGEWGSERSFETQTQAESFHDKAFGSFPGSTNRHLHEKGTAGVRGAPGQEFLQGDGGGERWALRAAGWTGGDTWEWKAEGDRIFFSSYEEEMEKTRFEQKITIALAGSLPAL